MIWFNFLNMLTRRPMPVTTCVVFSAAAVAWCCEDEHPPVQSTPVEKFDVGGRIGGALLKLAFDPRGVGKVVPHGDDAQQWIASEEQTSAWHYREWQWWRGHPWNESCRPRYYAHVRFRALAGERRGVVIDYLIDGFDCRQTFHLPESKARKPRIGIS